MNNWIQGRCFDDDANENKKEHATACSFLFQARPIMICWLPKGLICLKVFVAIVGEEFIAEKLFLVLGNVFKKERSGSEN